MLFGQVFQEYHVIKINERFRAKKDEIRAKINCTNFIFTKRIFLDDCTYYSEMNIIDFSMVTCFSIEKDSWSCQLL